MIWRHPSSVRQGNAFDNLQDILPTRSSVAPRRVCAAYSQPYLSCSIFYAPTKPPHSLFILSTVESVEEPLPIFGLGTGTDDINEVAELLITEVDRKEASDSDESGP
jgi:hypothetical protein